MGPGCLRRRTDGSHAVHRLGARTRRLRIRYQTAGGVARRDVGRLAGNAHRPGAAFHDRWQRGRDRAEQCEAHARLLDHCQHGLHAHGFSDRERQWLQRGDVLYAHLRAHDAGRLRHRAAALAQRL